MNAAFKSVTKKLVFGFALALMFKGLPAFAGIFDTETKLVDPDPAPGIFDRFGQSVGLSNTFGIVGAPRNHPTSTVSGVAYLFELATGRPLFQFKVSELTGTDSFGSRVGVSDETSIVGALNTNAEAGSAYIFDNRSGNLLFNLKGSDTEQGDNFGSSVAVSNNIAAVGARRDDEVGSRSGSAYLFDVITGEQISKLIASDAKRGAQFGQSVAIDDTTVIVGADLHDGSGSAYLFDTVTGDELFKLISSDVAAGDRFGGAVSISGNLAIVGAYLSDGKGIDSGSAYVFDTNTGAEVFKLTASDAAAGDRFGTSVAIYGDIAIVGANFDDDSGDRSGSAYLFDVTTGKELSKLTVAGTTWFGQSVALRGNFAFVGANGVNSAYLYTSIPEPNTLFLLTVAGIGYLTLSRTSHALRQNCS